VATVGRDVQLVMITILVSVQRMLVLWPSHGHDIDMGVSVGVGVGVDVDMGARVEGGHLDLDSIRHGHGGGQDWERICRCARSKGRGGMVHNT
jgi:hypothetical protein